MIRIQSVVFDHSEGSVTVHYFDESEVKPGKVSMYRTVFIEDGALKDWERVAYYVRELQQDAIELVEALVRYQAGAMPEGF